MATYHVFYTFRGRESHLSIDADSPVEAVDKVSLSYPQIKTVFKVQRIYTSKAVQNELSFVWSQAVANFIASLLYTTPKFYIEGNGNVSKEIEEKYQELTGEIIVPTKGIYNIAPDQKWGVEGSLCYDSSIPFPDDFGIEPELPGRVNSTKLFWTLIRLGFRIKGEHKYDEIVRSIPVEFRIIAGVG